MSETETVSLYCMQDRSKANILATDAGPQRVECPSCGQADTFDDACGEAARERFERGLGAFKSSGNVTVKKPANGPRWAFGAP